MRVELTKAEIAAYQSDGFVVIDDFLSEEELQRWRNAIDQAVVNRNGMKMPGREGRIDQADGINNVDVTYFSNVFDQLINLWQTDRSVAELICDPRIGQMATELSGCDGIRVWHDQALIKRPWANPTTLHLDLPYWSFDSPEAISIWIALDDATLENGCLYFLPGSHRHTQIDNADIGPNMNAIFELYPELATTAPVAAPMKAGAASFHNGLLIHGAGPNMTTGQRRAMTCAFMPEGSRYNGKPNILPPNYLASLTVGEVLNNEAQNPLLFSKHAG